MSTNEIKNPASSRNIGEDEKCCGTKILDCHECHVNVKLHALICEKPHKCKLCPKEYYRFTSLANHISHNHSRKEQYACDVCNLEFKHIASLKQHLNQFHMNKMLFPIGGINPEKKTLIDAAAITLSDIKEPNIVECIKSTKKREIRTPPLTEHGGNKRQRGISLVLRDDLGSSHSMERVGLHKKHMCPICKTLFRSPYSVKYHITATHSDNPGHLCAECGVKFKTKQALFFHKTQIHQSTSATGQEHQDKQFKQNSPYVRQSPNEDPHLWPKVLMSRTLNDLLASHSY